MRVEDLFIVGGLALVGYSLLKKPAPAPAVKPTSLENDPDYLAGQKMWQDTLDAREAERAAALTGEDLFSHQVFAEPTTITTDMGWGGTPEVVVNPTWGDVYWWGGP